VRRPGSPLPESRSAAIAVSTFESGMRAPDSGFASAPRVEPRSTTRRKDATSWSRCRSVLSRIRISRHRPCRSTSVASTGGCSCRLEWSTLPESRLQPMVGADRDRSTAGEGCPTASSSASSRAAPMARRLTTLLTPIVTRRRGFSTTRRFVVGGLTSELSAGAAARSRIFLGSTTGACTTACTATGSAAARPKATARPCTWPASPVSPGALRGRTPAGAAPNLFKMAPGVHPRSNGGAARAGRL
jgi:hypothetical protein